MTFIFVAGGLEFRENRAKLAWLVRFPRVREKYRDIRDECVQKLKKYKEDSSPENGFLLSKEPSSYIDDPAAFVLLQARNKSSFVPASSQQSRAIRLAKANVWSIKTYESNFWVPLSWRNWWAKGKKTVKEIPLLVRSWIQLRKGSDEPRASRQVDN